MTRMRALHNVTHLPLLSAAELEPTVESPENEFWDKLGGERYKE